MAGKNNANIGFEKQIQDAACELWGHIPAADYRKVIVGLIFLRYISFAFEKRYNQLVAEGDGFEDEKDAYTMEGIFYVPEAARWSKIAEAAHTPEIGMVIDEAMRAIEAENKTLKNVLPKNYANQDLDKRVLGNVVDLFTNNIDMSETDEDKDLLGRTHEYCIAQFAAYEGTKGGEFYTPSSIVKTIVEVLKPFDNCRVYDPCCGSGGMFVQSVKFLQAHGGNRDKISVYGQESNADTWKMAKMNMAIRGIDADFGPYQADTFFNDLHPHEKFDFIMANPPFNLSNWGQDKLLDDVRWKYGTPPAGNANYAWIQHMIHHLAPNGKIGLVLANGALSTQTSGEGEIRKNIIEADLVEGIIALPPQLFYSVTIPVTLWFISKNKQQKGRTVFIDARKMGYMVDRKHRDFTDEDIKKLADTFTAFQNGKLENVKGFCAVATTAEIAAQDYILTPGRYVGIEEQEDDGEPFEDKMKRLTGELSEMFKQSDTLQNEIREKLKAIGWEIQFMIEQQKSIAIYQSADGKMQIDVHLQEQTIWLSLDQISSLFQKDKSTISRHIKSVFLSEELDKESVVANFATTAKDGKTYQVDYYNLDMIISVGYRVNSKIATQFRKWATFVLKQYLVDGYAINEKRIQEQKSKVAQLQNAIRLLNRSIEHQADNLDDAKKLSALMADFASGLDLLDDYDNKTLDTKGKTTKPAVVIKKEEFLNIIDKMKPEFGSDVFANPKDESFDSSINQIYQTFGGQECYPSLEEKAAMLLYFLVKNHSFTDGNKRIGAACFLYFLDKNGILYQNNAQIIDNAALFALTVLIAESKPEEKEMMKQVIISVLNKGEI